MAAPQIWFTSDQHFSEARIIEYDARPYAAAQAMNDDLIARWNGAVSSGDIIYHLGDIFLTRSVAEARAIRAQLNGTIRLVRGNHDEIADAMPDAFDWIKDYYELTVPDPDARGGRQLIVLCHYALRVWRDNHQGAFHLYGHSHGRLADDPTARAFDVGCMMHGYAPISYARVKEVMAAKHYKRAIDMEARRKTATSAAPIVDEPEIIIENRLGEG